MTTEEAEQMISGLAVCCAATSRRFYMAGIPVGSMATTPAAVRRALQDAGIIPTSLPWWRRAIAWVTCWVARFFSQKFGQ